MNYKEAIKFLARNKIRVRNGRLVYTRTNTEINIGDINDVKSYSRIIGSKEFTTISLTSNYSTMFYLDNLINNNVVIASITTVCNQYNENLNN